jgi:hypothetical protein
MAPGKAAAVYFLRSVIGLIANAGPRLGDPRHLPLAQAVALKLFDTAVTHTVGEPPLVLREKVRFAARWSRGVSVGSLGVLMVMRTRGGHAVARGACGGAISFGRASNAERWPISIKGAVAPPSRRRAIVLCTPSPICDPAVADPGRAGLAVADGGGLELGDPGGRDWDRLPAGRARALGSSRNVLGPCRRSRSCKLPLVAALGLASCSTERI